MEFCYLNALSMAMRYMSPVKKRLATANVRENVKSVLVTEESRMKRGASNPARMIVYLNPIL